MRGVVVVGHDHIASGFISACDMILGNHDYCSCVCLTEGVESFANELYRTLDDSFEKYDSVIIMADVKGGTPFNQSLKYKLEKGKDNLFIVAGTNLPILMELLMRLNEDVDTEKLVKEVVMSGQASLVLEEPEDVTGEEDEDDII